MVLYLFLPPLGIDRLPGKKRSLIATRTMPADLLPRLFRLEIRTPEREGAALLGPGGIDAAVTALTLEEDAIAVRTLDQTFSPANQPDVLPLEDRHLDLQRLGHGLDFRFRDPNVPGISGATIAAPGALKIQAAMIPGELIIHRQ
jgi:hypothetical protein